MAKKKSDWQNRIVGHDTKPASWFLANEANWRIHPKNQQDSLGGVLDEVGWVQDVIVNKRTSEEWGADQNIETLVDGHLRITLALRNGDETPVPVKYVDLSPDEERLVLLTLDPLGAMAASDKAKLDELMRAVQSDDDRVQAMIAEIAEREGILQNGQDEKYSANIQAPIYEPKGEKPAIKDLYDETRTKELLAEIEASDLPEEEKEFLRVAARRHTVLNYKRIAEYYAHSDEKTQALMENSALVIIDFKRAIELGYIQMSIDISNQFKQDFDDK